MLAGGYFMSLYIFKQDLDHIAKEYGVGNYRMANPCALCACEKKSGGAWPLAFNNITAGARWRTTAYTASQWNAKYPDPHPLFQQGHITSLNIEPDEAHVLHLGVGQHVIGSVMWLMIYSCESAGACGSGR